MPRTYQLKFFAPFLASYSSVTFALVVRPPNTVRRINHLLRDHNVLRAQFRHYLNLCSTIHDLKTSQTPSQTLNHALTPLPVPIPPLSVTRFMSPLMTHFDPCLYCGTSPAANTPGHEGRSILGVKSDNKYT